MQLRIEEWRHGRLALIAICVGFFTSQSDATIVNIALSSIGRDVGGSFAGLQWVIRSYTLALAGAMLAAGSAADRVGARRAFEVGLLVFTLGSVACVGNLLHAPVRRNQHVASTAEGCHYSEWGSGGGSFVVVDESAEAVASLDRACADLGRRRVRWSNEASWVPRSPVREVLGS